VKNWAWSAAMWTKATTIISDRTSMLRIMGRGFDVGNLVHVPILPEGAWMTILKSGKH
jgi:hypothetical protein